MSKPYWVSWWASSVPFELEAPWWISGETITGRASICAAVCAESPMAAKELVLGAHVSRPADLSWRFAEERPPGWEPFSERFPRAGWMRWPWPAREEAPGRCSRCGVEVGATSVAFPGLGVDPGAGRQYCLGCGRAAYAEIIAKDCGDKAL